MSRMNSVMGKLRSTSSIHPSRSPTPLSLQRRSSFEGLLEPGQNSPDVAAHKSKKRPSSFWFPRPSSTPPTTPTAQENLPDDSFRLDGILNYHLGQIDRLRSDIDKHNVTIEQLSYTLRDIVMHTDLRYASKALNDRIQGVKNARNLLGPHLKYHLQEVERIIERKISLGSSVPQMHLPPPSEWTELFSFGDMPT